MSESIFSRESWIEQMLQAWETETPGRIDSLLRSMQNAMPSHLADGELFDFANL